MVARIRGSACVPKDRQRKKQKCEIWLISGHLIGNNPCGVLLSSFLRLPSQISVICRVSTNANGRR